MQAVSPKIFCKNSVLIILNEVFDDENFPDYLKAWSSKEFLHVTKIAKSIPEEIWKYALENNSGYHDKRF